MFKVHTNVLDVYAHKWSYFISNTPSSLFTLTKLILINLHFQSSLQINYNEFMNKKPIIA
jgi:hypothetical protein